MCLNCGALLRATVDKDGIEMCNNPNDIYDDNSRISSLFDLFVDSNNNGNSGAFFGETTTTTTYEDDRKSKQRRESTVIDVDVTKDD